MDKLNNYGAMTAACLIALVVGYGVFHTTTIRNISLPEPHTVETTTSVSEQVGTARTQTMEKFKLELTQEGHQREEQSHFSDSSAQPVESLLHPAAPDLFDHSDPQWHPSLSQDHNQFTEFQSGAVIQTIKQPTSTFSIDTDTASYSFVRRQLMAGRWPENDAVRVEELINYFDYNYPVNPDPQVPFTATAQVVPSPWNVGNKLIHIGIKAFETDPAVKPRSNLVFLIDTSGSMRSDDKLKLLVNSLKLLVNTLTVHDTVSIVTYAGSAGTVLPPTAIVDKHKILDALDQLIAGGSTAGQAGIQQAYALAQQHYDRQAVNRVFLATDGDFNVGIRDPEKLKDYIANKRDSGIFLSVLGFGDGNYNDRLMQALAQNGNGQAFYIDTLNEAQKILVNQASSTIFPVAKDVKIQIEFNPARVAEYRLIGYETRQLHTQDFNNDKIDAGEVGAGHSVTAIYEITPVGGGQKLIDEPRYGANQATKTTTSEFNDEYAFIKLRYKQPDSEHSKKITRAVTLDHEIQDFNQADKDVQFAIAVAAFGQLLKQSVYLNDMNLDQVLALAGAAKGDDPYGYRSEFIQLISLAKALDQP